MTTRRTAGQFRRFIVRPVLAALELASPAAENLLVGTALHESGLEALDQWVGAGDATLGPAIGVYQIEAPTLRDVLGNFLSYRPALRDRVLAFAAPAPTIEEQLASNLAWATAIARIVYYRAKEPLPAADDAAGLAAYWKTHFNTAGGKGDAATWLEHYRALA